MTPPQAQQGQTLVLGMIFAGAVALAIVRYFDAGMVVAAKARQDHALDAAAYSGALVQARALNMLSYMNRAQVAHQVAMAHLVTLGSLAGFAGAEASRVTMQNPPAYVIGMHFGADHAEAYLAAAKAAGLDHLSLESADLASAYSEHDRLARAVLSNVSAQLVAGLPAARLAAMHEVLAANYPGESVFDLSISDDNLEGFLAAYAGNPVLRPFIAQVSALYGFLDPRDHVARSAFPVDKRCPAWRHELRRRGVTVLDEQGRWQAIDTQSYHAVRSNRWIGCYYREYAMGWGWVPPKQAILLDAPHVSDAPEDFANQDFWRWVEGATSWDISGGNANPLANSWAYGSRRQWAGGGLPVFHDLKARNTEAMARFKVALRRVGRAGEAIHSVSAAETFFRRPHLRADGRRELPGTFHPYWQARLRNVSMPRNRRRPAARRRYDRPPFSQDGQALMETLVASFALAVMWVGIHWLWQYQDIALTAVHASGHSAFEATRIPPDTGLALEPASSHSTNTIRHFTGSAHRWADRRGEAFFNSGTDLLVSRDRAAPLSPAAQPGRATAHAEALRRDLKLADSGVLTANIDLHFSAGPSVVRSEEKPLLGLAAFDLPYPSLRRSISILTGAGHASSDREAHRRVAESPSAWASAYEFSRSIGATVASRADGLDDAWGRERPMFDWLRPWEGRVPPHLLTTYPGD